MKDLLFGSKIELPHSLSMKSKFFACLASFIAPNIGLGRSLSLARLLIRANQPLRLYSLPLLIRANQPFFLS